MHIDIADEKGVVERWSFEGPAPNRLLNTPVNRAVAEAGIGERVTIEWSPSRDGSRVGLIRMIELESGESMFLCPELC